MSKESIIKDIATAIYIKKRMDRQEMPKYPLDTVGRHVIIPDGERSNEDLLEDKELPLVLPVLEDYKGKNGNSDFETCLHDLEKVSYADVE